MLWAVVCCAEARCLLRTIISRAQEGGQGCKLLRAIIHRTQGVQGFKLLWTIDEWRDEDQWRGESEDEWWPSESGRQPCGFQRVRWIVQDLRDQAMKISHIHGWSNFALKSVLHLMES